ncbi:MAG: hypothetical protein R3324_16995, partial [Halobacteriales archaeon]|nr:hypothetical protein [Halobacteriales archaeon]
ALWTFYLPMLVVMFVLRNTSEREEGLAVVLGFAIFSSLLLKFFLTGYEYVTTTVIMLLVPLVYYAARERWSRRRSLELGTSAVLASGAACLSSLGVLAYQIGSVLGSYTDGVSYLVFRLGIRTHGGLGHIPDRFAAGVEATTGSVVATYLSGVYFDLENYFAASGPTGELLVFAVRYWQLTVVFVAASVYLIVRSRSGVESERSRCRAICYATWFSLLAPLSWFIVFKGHSYVHTHLNHVAWHMPFVFFGFATIGLAVRELSRLGRNHG